MEEWHLRITSLLRKIRQKAADALFALDDDLSADTSAFRAYLKADLEELQAEWSSRFSGEHLGNLGRHIHFAKKTDFFDILRLDIPDLERRADAHLQVGSPQDNPRGYERLLHPAVADASSLLAAAGQYREAVLTALIAVFDLVRARTGLDMDGERLITRVFSVDNPMLVLSDLESESGRNDQIGFMQLYQGAYRGIRNVKAHTLRHDLDAIKTVQYMVFASLLYRRAAEARVAT